MSEEDKFQLRPGSFALSVLQAATADLSFTVDELVNLTGASPENVRFVIHRYLLRGWLVPREKTGRPPRGFRYRWLSPEDKSAAQEQLAAGWLVKKSSASSTSKRAELSKGNLESDIRDKDANMQWIQLKTLDVDASASSYQDRTAMQRSKGQQSLLPPSRDALDPFAESLSHQKKILAEGKMLNAKTRPETKSNGKDENIIYSRKPPQAGK